jgi:hypothetical protein
MEFDLSAYVKRASKCFEDKVETIYVLAWGINVILGKSVVKEIEKTGKYAKREEYTFTSGGQGKLERYVAVLIKTNNQINP